jgi:hypothetical protein
MPQWVSSSGEVVLCFVLDFRPDDPLKRGMDVGEQPADAVGDAGGLTGEVVVEADRDFQLGERFVADVDAPQRVSTPRPKSACGRRCVAGE